MDFLTMSDEDKRREVQAQPFILPRFEEVQTSTDGVAIQLTLDPRTPGLRAALGNMINDFLLFAGDNNALFQAFIQMPTQSGPILDRYKGL